MNRLLIVFTFILLTTFNSKSEDIASLKQQILSITMGKKATVGVAVIYNNEDTLTINNEYRYPTMSVYKFHQALAVIDYLDKKGMPLDTKIQIKRRDLDPNTYSPMRDIYKDDFFELEIASLLKYSVSKSDNNACDILFKYIGGPQHVNNYIKNLGIADTYISATEKTMGLIPENQYLNWTTPLAAATTLNKFLNEELFSSTDEKVFLENTLIETTTGEDKIKALLPNDVIVGHKTGSSSRNDFAMKIADNDLGFVVLPNNNRYVIAVFVMNSFEDDKTNASIIAQISKIVYDYYSVQK